MNRNRIDLYSPFKEKKRNAFFATTSCRKKLFAALFIIQYLLCMNVCAQRTFDVELWQNGLPNSNGIDKTQPFDDSKGNFKPMIRVFLPDSEKSTGMAVVCCPGGGYSHLAMEHEGYNWADFFNEQGIALIVLKYRMPKGNREVPMSDATEAIRLVRANALDWGINPDNVGIMGSSAGGHLATTIATHSDSLTVPNFQILFYPVVTLDSRYTHKGTRVGFVGEDASQSLVDEYSNDKQVNKFTPRAIILLSDDDKVVVPQNSINYYQALKDKGIPASLHIYPSGGHGWGNRDSFKYHNQMLDDLKAWIEIINKK